MNKFGKVKKEYDAMQCKNCESLNVVEVKSLKGPIYLCVDCLNVELIEEDQKE